jgi:7-cyano-7-deazaguanine synthase in queuosine biosynthesis
VKVDTPARRGTRVEVSIHVDGTIVPVHWNFLTESVLDDDGAADAALTATLLSAMARQEPLTLEAPISARLAGSIAILQDVFDTWAKQSELLRGLPPVFRRVSVDVATRAVSPRDAEPVPDAASACFFSGGLDSLATAITRRAERVTLVYVHGLDVPLDDVDRRARLAGVVRHCAATLGLPLVEVETDVREFTDRDVDWLDGHGAALAGIAHLLGTRFRRVYVPATETYATLVPLGSHPLVDPLWSSERVELVHDGATANRLDKLRLVDTVPVARETLHVCVENDTDEFNCGRCWKCVMTMTGLRVLGLGDRFPTLPNLPEREFLHRLVESGTDASVRSWDRHRTTWAPYLAAARRHVSAGEVRRLEAALALRFAHGRTRRALHDRRRRAHAEVGAP